MLSLCSSQSSFSTLFGSFSGDCSSSQSNVENDVGNCSISENKFNEIDGQCLKSVFTAISHLGMDTVATLCEQKLSGMSEDEIRDSIWEFGQNNVDEIQSWTLGWLFELSNVDLQSIIKVIQTLKDERLNGLNYCKIENPDDQKIEIGKIGAHQLFIDKGKIFCSSSWFNLNATELVNSTQFLSMCKDNLNELNLPNLSMHDAKLSDVNFVGSTLTGANLKNADLSYANLEQSDLRGANLQGTSFYWATLKNVRLSGATIDSKSNFDGAEITLNLRRGKWTKQSLNHHLNHLKPGNSTSFLTFINEINDSNRNRQGERQKVDLMRQVIESFGDSDVSCIYPALTDIFINNPIYATDKRIARFIKDKILIHKIALGNDAPLKGCCPMEYRLMVDAVNELDEIPKKDFMIGNNNYFIQLIAACTAPDQDKQLIAVAEELYNYYLNLYNVKPFKSIVEQDATVVDGCITNIGDGDDALLFFKMKGETATPMGFLTNRLNLKAMLTSDSGHDWCRIYYMQDNRVALVDSFDLPKMTTLYTETFPLFKTRFLQTATHFAFKKLLDAINLGDYQLLFEDALTKTSSSVKLIKEEDIAALSKIFQPHIHNPENNTLGRNYTLTPSHFEAICKIYCSIATGTDQANVLFCLAAIFAKFTSSTFFGTEDDSPYMIRMYVVAFLNKVAELNPNLVNKKLLNEWLDALTGIRLSCTGTLSKDMMSYANNHQPLKEILSSLKPLPW